MLVFTQALAFRAPLVLSSTPVQAPTVAEEAPAAPTPDTCSRRAAGDDRREPQRAPGPALGCAASARAASCRGRPGVGRREGKASQVPHARLPRGRVTRRPRPAFSSSFGPYIRSEVGARWALGVSIVLARGPAPGESPSGEGAAEPASTVAFRVLCPF